MATPPWQMRIQGQWNDCDVATSTSMEAAFNVSTTSIEKIPFRMGDGQAASGVAEFNLLSMTFGDFPVRRRKMNEPEGIVEFWADTEYEEYDRATTNTVLDAVKARRSRVTFHANSEVYEVCIEHGVKRAYQENLRTKVRRPLHIRLPNVVDTSPLNITSKADQAVNLPSEFYCPITHAIMRVPVMAADGFTYEEQAIRRWLASRSTSPTTGEELPHDGLALNRALRSLIADACCV